MTRQAIQVNSNYLALMEDGKSFFEKLQNLSIEIETLKSKSGAIMDKKKKRNPGHSDRIAELISNASLQNKSILTKKQIVIVDNEEEEVTKKARAEAEVAVVKEKEIIANKSNDRLEQLEKSATVENSLKRLKRFNKKSNIPQGKKAHNIPQKKTAIKNNNDADNNVAAEADPETNAPNETTSLRKRIKKLENTNEILKTTSHKQQKLIETMDEFNSEFAAYLLTTDSNPRIKQTAEELKKRPPFSVTDRSLKFFFINTKLNCFRLQINC